MDKTNGSPACVDAFQRGWYPERLIHLWRKPVSTPVALVLGGHGLLGQPLAQQLAGNGWEAQSLDFEDCNLLNPVELQPRIEFINPDVIFNTVSWNTETLLKNSHKKPSLSTAAFRPSSAGWSKARPDSSSTTARIRFSTAARTPLTPRRTRPIRSPRAARAALPVSRPCLSSTPTTSASSVRAGCSARMGTAS